MKTGIFLVSLVALVLPQVGFSMAKARVRVGDPTTWANVVSSLDGTLDHLFDFAKAGERQD